MTPGKDTSEFKLTAKAVIGLIVTILGCVASAGLLPPEHLVLKAITGLIAVAGVLGIGQVTSAYTKGRSQLKSMVAMPPPPSGDKG